MTPQRAVRFEGVHCHLGIERFPRNVIVLKIEGTDVGEFEDAPLNELSRQVSSSDPVELFIDAREGRGASIHVSGSWAEWLKKHREHLSRVHMVTGSRFVEVTANFVRRFAALEGLMIVHPDAKAFDAALAESQRGGV